ncbi:TraQ conjugal transfer family protein, partial [Bacteroides caecimuris]|uniref:TraQ conjugal transfer family protein n=1 Tax=Bacteroides caecimuris TaxID=1796613 RepID=UPI002575BEB5
NYANTLYTIRYFQYDGEGSLKLVDGPVLVNNDRVLLESKTFRLNYTAKSSEAHKFLVVIEDNFGSTPWEQTFEFNGKDSGDNGGETPGIIGPIVGPITPIGL